MIVHTVYEVVVYTTQKLHYTVDTTKLNVIYINITGRNYG